MSNELVRYDAMCNAIAAAYDTDEVKDIRDKARAIEVYARQAKNVEAERQACEIRLRAERKWAELKRKEGFAKGGEQYHSTPNTVSVVPEKTLSDIGVSYKQSSDWQKLADIPDEDFERAVRQPGATTSGIIAAYAPSPARDALKTKALWLWGRLQDFEREGLLEERPADLLAVMSDHMKVTTSQLAPIVTEWLEELINEC
jgi:hypothetical protein